MVTFRQLAHRDMLVGSWRFAYRRILTGLIGPARPSTIKGDFNP